jgi:hypothetical protein
MYRAQIPFGQITLRRRVFQAGDDIGDEPYYRKTFAWTAIVEGGVFDPCTLTEPYLEP